jgi:hypothetical protein
MCLKKNRDYAQRVEIDIAIDIAIEFITGICNQLGLRIL